jgi:hypothetical protein
VDIAGNRAYYVDFSKLSLSVVSFRNLVDLRVWARNWCTPESSAIL